MIVDMQNMPVKPLHISLAVLKNIEKHLDRWLNYWPSIQEFGKHTHIQGEIARKTNDTAISCIISHSCKRFGAYSSYCRTVRCKPDQQISRILVPRGRNANSCYHGSYRIFLPYGIINVKGFIRARLLMEKDLLRVHHFSNSQFINFTEYTCLRLSSYLSDQNISYFSGRWLKSNSPT
jgi:hypothetical protein